ncbi:MAG: MFS transporter [Candidatus Heimdallarchaeota archaeon]|nr:MFS transporter [Candidatus Heimdallarchaeota archaeon]
MIDENIVRRNVRAYMISRIGWLSGTIVAIVGLWIRDNLTFSEMLLLQGLFALMLLIMEVPTGIIADLFERKKVIMFGYVNISIGLIAYALLHGFNGFLLAEFFFSIGVASISGADTAAIWDTYLEVDDEPGAHKIIASGKIVLLGSAVILTVSGGILASYSLTGPLYIASVGVFVNAILYAKSFEIQRHKVESAKVAWVKSLKMFKVAKFKEAFLLGIMLAVVLRIAFWGYIPKLEDYNVDPFWFGFALAGANLVAVSTTYFIGNRNKNGKVITFFAFATSAMGVILFAIDNALWIVLFAIGLHQIGRAIIGVIVLIKINKATESDIRASAISLMSMSVGFVYFVATLLFDLLSKSRNQIMVLNVAISLIILGFWILQQTIFKSKIEVQNSGAISTQQ